MCKSEMKVTAARPIRQLREPSSGVDHLGRRGVGANQPGRHERQPDCSRHAPDPRGLAHADKTIAQPARPGHPRRRFQEVTQTQELDDRQRGQDRQPQDERDHAEKPLDPRRNRPRDTADQPPDPRPQTGPRYRLEFRLSPEVLRLGRVGGDRAMILKDDQVFHDGYYPRRQPVVSRAIGRHAGLCLAAISAERFAISSAGTSSTCVATCQ